MKELFEKRFFSNSNFLLELSSLYLSINFTFIQEIPSIINDELVKEFRLKRISQK